MARNCLIIRKEIAASQTGATLIDPGSGAGLIVDWITIMPTTDIEVEVWHGAAQTDTNTIIHVERGGVDKDFRSPSRGTGLQLPKGEVLKLTNGADTVKVVIGYHLDNNAAS